MFAGSRLVASVPLSRDVIYGTADAPIGELQMCTFSVEPSEPEQRYALKVGDEAADPRRDDVPRESAGEAHLFPGAAHFEGGIYFESARGETIVTLLSLSTASDDAWRPRARLLVRVVPSKIGEERYQAMYEALARLSRSFVEDLVSKSISRVGFGTSDAGVRVHSPQARLRSIERICTALAPPLASIQRSPSTVLQRKTIRRAVWGPENLRSRSLAELAESGFSFDRRDLPMKASVPFLVESWDTPEHGMIKWFLVLVLTHLNECIADARANIEALTGDFTMLSGFKDAQLSIQQRIRSLEEAVASAEARRTQIRAFGSAPPLDSVQPRPRFQRTPVFENVPPYRRTWDLMRSYTEESAVIVGSEIGERVKATWKMYEQWLFFQLAAAIRTLGFRCEEEFNVLQRKSRYRFTLDLDYGSRLSFRGRDGEIVSVTYQPKIFGYDVARHLGDTLFRGRSGQAPWTPDVIIEVFDREREPDKPLRVLHALVIDAKYSRKPTSRHWDSVGKYSEIRATASKAAVVKQVWIAYPGNVPGIDPVDDWIKWGPEGVTASADETVRGAISLIPHTLKEPQAGDPISDEPAPILLEFLSRMFPRFGIPMRQPLAETA